MKLTGKWIDLEKKVILSEFNQMQNDKYGIYNC